MIEEYLEAWNGRGELSRCFAPGGTFEDPDGRSSGIEIDAKRDRWRAGFPDLSFEVRSRDTRTVEWTMRGKNLGVVHSFAEPTGKEISLAGIDVIDAGPEGIRSVRRYFDQKTLIEQMGLMCLVQPIEQGPARYGYAMRVPSANKKPPKAIGLTFIQGANEDEKERIRAHARQNVRDFLREPGFISIVTGFIGLRGFTVTAWEDEASLQRALSHHHEVAKKELLEQDFVASVWTSVWQPTRIHRIWVRCRACASLEDESDDHRACSKCGRELPERPEYW